MGHSVRVWVGPSSSWVMFGLNEILDHFGLSRVWFSSGRFWVNQFLVKYACHAKTSNFVENFGSGMVRFGAIQVSGQLSGVGSGMDPSRSVRISGLGSVLPDLAMVILTSPWVSILPLAWTYDSVTPHVNFKLG